MRHPNIAPRAAHDNRKDWLVALADSASYDGVFVWFIPLEIGNTPRFRESRHDQRATLSIIS